LLFLAVALLGLMLGSVQSAEAATACSVPSVNYPTIQSAVNDPNCNPINVAAGTYPEQVTINRTVTLLGAQAGVDARTRVATESIIDHPCGPVQIEADNATIDGFTVQGPSQRAGFSRLAESCRWPQLRPVLCRSISAR
jgi:pectin methylesterase-like acyl-CoA thioesterase